MDLHKTFVPFNYQRPSESLLPGILAYYADEARGCTAEAVPTGDDDDAKIPRPSEQGGGGGE